MTTKDHSLATVEQQTDERVVLLFARTELSEPVGRLNGRWRGGTCLVGSSTATGADVLAIVALMPKHGDEPPKPPTGQPVSDVGGQERVYPAVEGGGEVPFTPDNTPGVTDERLDHIMVGEPRRRDQAWSGGHGFGAGKGKAEFPQTWTHAVVKAAIEQVLSAPASIRRKGSKLEFRGVVDGLLIVVVVRGRSGPPKMWTAYPEWTP